MQPVKTIRLTWTFYKSFLIFSLLVNACCLRMFWSYGFAVFVELFWFKMASVGLTYYFINNYKNKEYYYYSNLGISKATLWTLSLIFDLALFTFLFILINRFK